MPYNGINILTGIAPGTDNINYRYNNYECLSTVFAIDHNAVIKGIPLGSKGSLTRDYTPLHIPAVGSLYKKETFPGINYSGIGLITTIRDGVIAEITPELNVTLNGILIATSPKYATTKTGKEKARTQSEKLRFCKAVVWALINDETSLKDKLVDIGYVPPVNDSVKDFMIENITMSPYPGPAIVDEYRYTVEYAYLQNSENLKLLLDHELSDMDHDEIWNNVSLDQENNPESADEIINAFCTIPAGMYYPHLKVYIQECVLA